MIINIDKELIIENVGASTRPPVGSVPPAPTFGRNPNPAPVKDPNQPQVTSSGDTRSFAEQKLQDGSKMDSSMGLRTLLKKQ